MNNLANGLVLKRKMISLHERRTRELRRGTCAPGSDPMGVVRCATQSRKTNETKDTESNPHAAAYRIVCRRTKFRWVPPSINTRTSIRARASQLLRSPDEARFDSRIAKECGDPLSMHHVFALRSCFDNRASKRSTSARALAVRVLAGLRCASERMAPRF